MIGTGRREGRLYKIAVEIKSELNNQRERTLNCEIGDKRNNSELWHLCLGYLGYQNMKKLQSIVTGIDGELDTQQNNICKGC